MRLWATAALVAVSVGCLSFVAAAPARNGDGQATLEYLRAYAAFLRDARRAIPAGAQSADAFVTQIASNCPNALAHAPRGKPLAELFGEALDGALIAFIQPLSARAASFAARADTLRWSNRRLTRLVRLADAQQRALARIMPPQLCSDIAAWVAGGYQGAPHRTTRFLAALRGLAQEGTIHGRPLEGQILRLLAPYEGRLARDQARAVQRAKRRLRAAIANRLGGLLARVGHELGGQRERKSAR
jgi:hypothetical protein